MLPHHILGLAVRQGLIHAGLAASVLPSLQSTPRIDLRCLQRTSAASESKDGRPRIPFIKLLFPILDSEKELSENRMQNAIATTCQTAGLSSAIMGGVAAAGVLGYSSREAGRAVVRTATHGDDAGFWWFLADELLPFPFSQEFTACLVLPMYSTSFFLNIHMLMLSYIVGTHVATIPKELVLGFARRFPFTIGMCGWLQAPALITLGMAMICHIHQISSPIFAGYALALYATTGIFSTYHVFSLAWWNRVERLKLLKSEDQHQHQPQPQHRFQHLGQQDQQQQQCSHFQSKQPAQQRLLESAATSKKPSGH